MRRILYTSPRFGLVPNFFNTDYEFCVVAQALPSRRAWHQYAEPERQRSVFDQSGGERCRINSPPGVLQVQQSRTQSSLEEHEDVAEVGRTDLQGNGEPCERQRSPDHTESDSEASTTSRPRSTRRNERRSTIQK